MVGTAEKKNSITKHLHDMTRTSPSPLDFPPIFVGYFQVKPTISPALRQGNLLGVEVGGVDVLKCFSWGFLNLPCESLGERANGRQG